MALLSTGLALAGGAAGGLMGQQSAEKQQKDLLKAVERQNRIMDENLRRQQQAREESMALLESPTGRMQSAFDMGDDTIRRMEEEQSRMMPGLRDAFGQMRDTAQGDYLHAEDNPYLQSHIEAAQRPIQQKYEEDIRPQLTSQAIQQGAFGGSREGLTQARAARDHQRELGDVSSQMAAQNYQQERSNQLQAAQSLPSLSQQTQQVQQQPAQMSLQMGEIDQQRQNQRAQAAQMTPQREVPSLQQTEAGAKMMAPDPTEQAMQGMMGGMSMGSSLGSSLSGMMPSLSGMFGGGSNSEQILSGSGGMGSSNASMGDSGRIGGSGGSGSSNKRPSAQSSYDQSLMDNYVQKNPKGFVNGRYKPGSPLSGLNRR